MNIFKHSFILQINKLIIFVNREYNRNRNIGNSNKRIIIHFLKSHSLVKLFIRLSFIYLNFFSLIVYQNKIQNLEYRKFQKLIFFFKRIKILQFIKIIELFHALLIIHHDAKENIRKKKINKIQKIKNFYENIVVGSGPAGSITANTLLDNNKDVLLIEKGNAIEHFELKHPGNELFSKWKNGGIASSIGNSQIQYASAECMGGGSEINSGLYHEPDENFLYKWSKEFETKDLDFKNLEPLIKETKKKTNVSFLENSKNDITDYLKKGALKNSWRLEEIPRWVFKEKNSYKKKSMMESYLKTYLSKDGHIIPNTSLEKIKKKDSIWELTVIKNNIKNSVKCKNLFLCCGSIYSNFILRKNNLIKKKNNINFHPMIKVIVKFPKKINFLKSEIIPQQITEFVPDFIIGNAASGLQFLKISSFNDENLYNEVIKDWEYMSIFHVTFSLGEGEVLKLPFIKDPVIKYKMTNKDLKIIKNGLEKLCKLLFDSGCEYIYPLIQNSKKLNNQSYIGFIESIKDLKKINLSSVHILGGAPMGEQKFCLTDSYGKVKGYNNLYINDSSLICTKLLKNPQGTVMAIALRNIENFIRNDK
tara:strand:- start:8640 stop:10409 length:1770 start_codon:yes stop_codon:yes gene_type:complete